MKELLPQVEKYFKTNLHTHSTISDGIIDRREVKERYKAAGYSVLALTDHNVIYDHSDMNDPDFLMLTGIEVNHNSDTYRPRFDGKVYHFNLIAKDPTNTWTPHKILKKYPGAVGFEEGMTCEHMDMSYSVEAANAMIAKANEKGFLVMYNHPTWSCQTWDDYAPLKGLWGMELRNTECCMLGYDENNFRVYKDLLKAGNRVFPLGTDDMHYPRSLGKSWIMLGASALNYRSVMEALENGDFYMSCGPEITGLYVEDNVLKVTCSEAQRVNLEAYGRFSKVVLAQDEPLRKAAFPLENFITHSEGDPNAFLYITVTAKDGTYATTCPYYLKDLLV